ncbi:MAG: PIN domain-containing protein [Eubacteriales bacterium]|nr:PIN domain-containing protein [Eubacteriales bacterium]
MIDTNIVLDVFLQREPFFQASYEVMKQSAIEKLEGFISASAATDIYYLLRRSLKDNERAKESMEKLLQLVGVADALGEDVHAAVSSNMNDLEDALVASIAERCQMEYIITRNAKDYTESPVKAITPEDFLRL